MPYCYPMDSYFSDQKVLWLSLPEDKRLKELFPII